MLAHFQHDVEQNNTRSEQDCSLTFVSGPQRLRVLFAPSGDRGQKKAIELLFKGEAIVQELICQCKTPSLYVLTSFVG